MGMLRFCITHSPWPSWLYTPQWMKSPNFASRNHARAAARSDDWSDEGAARVRASTSAPDTIAHATSESSGPTFGK